MTYIHNWRIMKAYSLVKYSNATLQRIAETVGFASARTLTKAFQRHYGCTPNALRRKQDIH
jgi:transcriptional regulator GlxA family with amidase domain